MTISEMIAALEQFRAQHGDLEVETFSGFGNRVKHRGPVLDHRRILKGRERKPQFAWHKEDQGEPVCRL